MALESVIVDYQTNSLSHKLTIDCGEDPIDVTIFWKKATDSTYTEEVSLSSKTGEIEVNVDFDKSIDIVSPPAPIVDVASITYDVPTEMLKFNVDIPQEDNGTQIDYLIVDNTNEIQIDSEVGFVISGINSIAVKVDGSSNTELTASDSVGLQTEFELFIPYDGKINYIHTASTDTVGNISETITEEIDLGAPTKDTSFYLNEIRIGINNQLLRFNTNRMTTSISGASHPRGAVIFRDIKLIDSSTQEVLGSESGLTNVDNIDLGVSPFNNPKIGNDTVLQLVSTAYNEYGSTEGESLSRTFKIDLSTPSINIDFTKDLPLMIADSNYEPMNLKWNTTGDMAPSVVSYKIQRRTRLNSDLNWSEWTDIGTTSSKSFNITTDKININGFNVHEFRVCGVTTNGNTSFFNYPEYISDILPIISTSIDSLMYVVRVPVGVYNLIDRELVLSASINGVTKTHKVSVEYDEFTSTIGKGDIGFITVPVDPEMHINGDGSTNTSNVVSSVRDMIAELEMLDEFNEDRSVQHKVKVEGVSTDVYLVGYIVDDMDKFANEHNITFSQNSSNPFRDDAIVDIVSALDLNIVSTGGTQSSIDLSLSDYTLAKYKDLHPPKLDFKEDYTNEGSSSDILEFSPPIYLKAELDSRNSNIDSSMVTIETEYMRTEGPDYEVVDDFNLNDPLTSPGSYQVYSRIVYNDGINELVSEEAVLSFSILDIMGTYETPTISVDNSSNDGSVDSLIKVTINTNVEPDMIDDSTYIYYLENVTNSKSLRIDSSSSIGSVDSFGNRVYVANLDTVFLEYGSNDVSLSVTYSGNQFLYGIDLDLIKPIENPVTSTKLLGPVTQHDSTSGDTSARYNDAWVKTPSNYNVKNSMIIARIRGKNLGVMPNYKIPFFDKHDEVKTVRYSVPNGLRTSVKNVGSTFLGSVVEEQVFNTTLQDDKTKPPTPTISVSSNKPLSPFNSDGSGPSIVMDGVKFNVTNKGSDYTTKCFIDGKPYTEGSNFTRAGKHSFMCIFSSTYNYKISHKVIEFEIKKESMYLPPFINFSPSKKWEEQYSITIDWYMSDQEVSMGNSIRKEYMRETDSSWVLVSSVSNGKTTFEIDVNDIQDDIYVINARKTYPDGHVINQVLEIPLTYAIRDGVIPSPNIDFTVSSVGKNDSVYTPSITKYPEFTYTWKLNGLPYIEGTPITNYEHNKREFNLEIEVKDRYSDNRRTFSRKFTIDTIPPIKPLLANYKNKIIYDLDDFYSIEVANKEAGVDYTIILDGQEISERSSIEIIPKDRLNGTHTIVIYARKKSNQMVNFSQYIFHINTNSHTTGRFHTKEISSVDNEDNTGKETRIPIIPLSRQLNSFDTPGELVINKKNGDLSIVTNEFRSDGNGYEVEDITKKLRFSLRRISNNIDQLKKSFNISNDIFRALEYPLGHYKTVNDGIRTKSNATSLEIDRIESEISTLVAKLTRVRNDINSARSKFNTDSSGKEVSSQSIKTALGKYNARKKLILDDHDKHLDLMSILAKINFNLRSIEIVANPKVSKTAFESHKSKYERFYQDIRTKVRNFK